MWEPIRSSIWHKLSFDDHISQKMQKIWQKNSCITNCNIYINISKRSILMNAFFESQFIYYFLVWICYSRVDNGKINRLYKRCLWIMYSNNSSSIETLLEKHVSVSIHNRNLQILANETYKIEWSISFSCNRIF